MFTCSGISGNVVLSDGASAVLKRTRALGSAGFMGAGEGTERCLARQDEKRKCRQGGENEFRFAMEKHVVITGGLGGLGAAVVDVFWEQGAICHVPAEHSVQSSDERERVSIRGPIDLCDEKSVVSYYDSLPTVWASVHLVGGFSMGPLEETTLASFQHLFQLNAVSSFLCSREAVRVMRVNDGGRIVNVGARPAVEPVAGMVAYATAKAAVASMTQCFARETKEDGICVNAILPSIIDTASNRQAMPDADFDSWPKPDADCPRYCVSLLSGTGAYFWCIGACVWTSVGQGLSPHPSPPPEGEREYYGSLSPSGGGLGWEGA